MPESPTIHRGTIPCPVCGVEPGQLHVGDTAPAVAYDHTRGPNRPDITLDDRDDS